MSSDYSYDEEGHLWPFFVFTLTTIVTLPLTYVLVNRTRDPAASFPRIKTDYAPKHSGIVKAAKLAEKRRHRRLGLAFFVIAGWAVMGYMLYLISITEAPNHKLWNPYDILGLSEVGAFPPCL